MHESALLPVKNRNERIALRQASRILGLALCFAAGVAFPKATKVTLPELVQSSQIVVYGSIRKDDRSSSSASAASVPLTISQILKGTSAQSGVVMLCKRRSSMEYPDWPDIAAISGDNILFLKRSDGCFDLAHNYRALVKVRNGRATTGEIQGQPEEQPLELFLEKVRRVVSKQSQPDAAK